MYIQPFVTFVLPHLPGGALALLRKTCRFELFRYPHVSEGFTFLVAPLLHTYLRLPADLFSGLLTSSLALYGLLLQNTCCSPCMSLSICHSMVFMSNRLSGKHADIQLA